MVDFNIELINALEKVLPTHYEMALSSNTETPCISYMETNNYVSNHGSTLGYSYITYQIKIWANNIELIQKYAKEVDAVLRPLGLTRISSGELYDNESSMIQKIMSYQGLALEDY